jgi:hypothetical protein
VLIPTSNIACSLNFLFTNAKKFKNHTLYVDEFRALTKYGKFSRSWSREVNLTRKHKKKEEEREVLTGVQKVEPTLDAG